MPVRDLLSAASSQGGVSDPYFYDVSLLLNGDGTNGAQNNTFLDSSTNNFTITRNGNTTQGSFSPYGTLWSNYIDGAGLTAPNNSAFAFSTGDFSIECWYKANTTISPFQQVVGTQWFGTSPNGKWIMLIGNAATGAIEIQGIASGSGTTIIQSSATSAADGGWHHIAITRSGTTVRAFVDGAVVQTSTSSYDFQMPNSSLLYIGQYYNPGDGSHIYGNGYISNLRIVKGTAVYTSAFTPSTTPLTAISGTSILTCQSNRFIDNSSNAFAITVNGTPSVQRFSPFNPTAPYSTSVIGGSGYFDGSGDSLTVPQNSAFNFGTGAFTVESWVYITKFTSQTENRIIGLGLGANPGIFTGWSLIIFKNSNELSWYRYDGTVYSLTGSATFTTGQWYHIVAVRNGSSNLSMYVNGTRIYNNTSATLSYNNVNSDPVYFATQTTGAGALDVGCYLTDTKVVSGTATYDPTQTTITIPASPISATTNTQLLTNFTNAGIPDLAMQNNLETVGNAQVSTSVKKYGTGSLAFDGTGDYLQLPASQTVNFGLGNFTIEFWAYWAGGVFSGYNSAFDSRSGNSPYTDGVQIAANIINGYWYLSFAAQELLTSVAATAAWQHIALVRNNGVYTLYIDGTSAGTYTASNNMTNTTALIGTYYNKNGQYWNGYIDDLRITKGLARYTANFTPPTSALPTY